MSLFQIGPERYQPRAGQSDNYARINQRALALVVGIVAVGLPTVLYLASHNPVLPTCFRYSISHFYYAPFWGTVFTGALVFIGAYLLVYRGEDAGGAENRLSTYAGLAAFGIALFPTGGWGCDMPPFTGRPMLTFELIAGAAQITPASFEADTTLLANPDAAFRLFNFASTIHYVSAAIVFLFLAWFNFFVFTAVDDDQRGPNGKPTAIKVARNAIYYVTGGIILLAIVAMALSAFVQGVLKIPLQWWDAGNWTFWCEAAALTAFGVAWLVKGRFIRLLEDKLGTA